MALVKYNNNSISAVTSTGIPSGALTHIKTLTASSSSTLSFVDGTDGVVFDSTYPIYKFVFTSIHPSGSNPAFQFNMSTDGGSNYNVTKTSSFMVIYHYDPTDAITLGVDTGFDLAQSTAFQSINPKIGGGADESGSGTLTIFNPSSTTFVKHFMSSGATHSYSSFSASYRNEVCGYGNTTSAVDAIRFQMDSGNMDAGTIKLYGIKDS
jgi:hypothetical protein